MNSSRPLNYDVAAVSQLMNTIELDVLLEFRDFLRATYWFFFRRFKFVLILFVIVLVVYPLLLFSGQISTSANDNYWGLLIPAGILFFLLINPYFSARRQMTSNKCLNQRLHYVFDETGIDATAPLSSGHTSWANIHKAYETSSNFLLFISKNMMYTIPKRCFVDGSQIDGFRQLLKSQLVSRAKLK